MSLFTSAREKKLWFYALLVWMAILSSLIFAYPLFRLLGNENSQALLFILCMGIIGTTIILHAFRRKLAQNDIVNVLGIVAVFLMLFLRLGLAERTHLIEYSVLTIFIHRALIVRYQDKHKGLYITILALLLSLTIGVFDEFIQVFIPNRVFDMADFLFNGLAAGIAIGASLLWQWIKKMLF